MIEEIIIDYLTPHLSVPVSTQKKENHPVSYVLVERTGGGMENQIRSAMVAIQSYGGTQLEAAQLHEVVISLMLDIVELDEIGSCKLNAEYNFPDEETKEFRYQAVFDLIYY